MCEAAVCGATSLGTPQLCIAAAVMSLIQSARINGHDPYAHLKDVFTRLATQPASGIEELFPHRWKAVEYQTQQPESPRCS